MCSQKPYHRKERRSTRSKFLSRVFVFAFKQWGEEEMKCERKSGFFSFFSSKFSFCLTLDFFDFFSLGFFDTRKKTLACLFVFVCTLENTHSLSN